MRFQGSQQFRVSLWPNALSVIELGEPSDSSDGGVSVNVVRTIGKRLSFFTTGQEVPDHLEVGRPDRLAALIMGEGVHP